MPPNDLPAVTPETTPPAGLPAFAVNLAKPDLSPWVAGNTGIAGFTTRESRLAGPHVALISLIHGNEIAGAIVLDELMRAEFQPARGKLTFGFANLAAFETFSPENPLGARCLDEDMNRVWDDFQLFGVRRSAELDRAREIRPIIDSADIVLDLHSMLWTSPPLLLSGASPQGRALAMQVGTPSLVVADSGHAAGKRLLDYGRFTEAGAQAACILVEAGQHWEPETVTQTRLTVQALLSLAGMAPPCPPPTPPRFAEVTDVITARTHRFCFTQNFKGGDVIASAGTVIAYDGDETICTPYDACMLVMPSLRASLGHTAVRLARVCRV